jgi:hypothetical protein
MEEGSSSPTPSIANTSTVYNYCQIFREPFYLTGTRARTEMTPGLSPTDLSKKAAEQFQRNVELAAIFGTRDENTSDFSEVRHSSGGFIEYVSTNVSTIGGALAEDVFDTFLIDKAFKYGSSTKFAFCGSNYFRCLAKWKKGYAQIEMDFDRLNTSITQYVAPTGQILNLVHHELFSLDPVGTLAGLMIVVDPNEISARYTQNPSGNPTGIRYQTGQIQYGEDLQSTSEDAIKAEYFAEIGFQIMNEQKHAVMKTVTGPA